MDLPILTERNEVLRTKIFTLVEESYSRADREGTFTRIKIEHPGAAVILPQKSDGTLLLVSQYRAALQRVILEFPAGTLEPKEDPLECAKREIVEEVGFAASEWRSLGELFPAPGFCDEKQHLFFASALSPAEMKLDEDEMIEVVEMSAAEVETAIASNLIVDAKSVSLFFRAKLAGCFN